MATFRNKHGKWQARVQCKGQQPISKSFQSKEDAQLDLEDPEELALVILETRSK